jgi:hypothetical protein
MCCYVLHCYGGARFEPHCCNGRHQLAGGWFDAVALPNAATPFFFPLN